MINRAHVDTTIAEALESVYDPCCREKGISVVDMGLLHRAQIEDGVAQVELILTSGWCPFASSILNDIEAAVQTLPGVRSATVQLVWDEVWSSDRLSEEAHAKLRFLPEPVAAGTPEAYAAKQPLKISHDSEERS